MRTANWVTKIYLCMLIFFFFYCVSLLLSFASPCHVYVVNIYLHISQYKLHSYLTRHFFFFAPYSLCIISPYIVLSCSQSPCTWGSAKRWRERWKRRETPLSPFHLEYEHHQQHGASRHHEWDPQSSRRQQLWLWTARTLPASLCPWRWTCWQPCPVGDGGLQTAPPLTQRCPF